MVTWCSVFPLNSVLWCSFHQEEWEQAPFILWHDFPSLWEVAAYRPSRWNKQDVDKMSICDLSSLHKLHDQQWYYNNSPSFVPCVLPRRLHAGHFYLMREMLKGRTAGTAHCSLFIWIIEQQHASQWRVYVLSTHEYQFPSSRLHLFLIRRGALTKSFSLVYCWALWKPSVIVIAEQFQQQKNRHFHVWLSFF